MRPQLAVASATAPRQTQSAAPAARPAALPPAKVDLDAIDAVEVNIPDALRKASPFQSAVQAYLKLEGLEAEIALLRKRVEERAIHNPPGLFRRKLNSVSDWFWGTDAVIKRDAKLLKGVEITEAEVAGVLRAFNTGTPPQKARLQVLARHWSAMKGLSPAATQLLKGISSDRTIGSQEVVAADQAAMLLGMRFLGDAENAPDEVQHFLRAFQSGSSEERAWLQPLLYERIFKDARTTSLPGGCVAALYQALADPQDTVACAQGARLLASLELSATNWTPQLADLFRRLVVGAQSEPLRADLRTALFPNNSPPDVSPEVLQVLKELLFAPSADEVIKQVASFREQPGGMSEPEAQLVYRQFHALAGPEQREVVRRLKQHEEQPGALDKDRMEALLAGMTAGAPQTEPVDWS